MTDFRQKIPIDEITKRRDFPDKFVIEDAYCVDSSTVAIMCHIPGKGTLWFPDHQIDTTSEVVKVRDRGKLVISLWLAKEKRLYSEPKDRQS